MHLTSRSSASKPAARFHFRVLALCGAIDRWNIEYRLLEKTYRLNETCASSRLLAWERAAERFKSGLLHYAGLDRKANFNPDQPRWPAGSGEISGRWSGGGGAVGTSDATEFSAQRRVRRDGHHFLPRAHYRHLAFSKEVRKVFDEAKTGQLRFIHGWDEPHARYNEATKELMDHFMQRHNIQPEQMTVVQARFLIKEIHESRDPRIRNFNIKIRLREYLYRIRAVRARGNE